MYISCAVDKLPMMENKYEQHITLMYDVRNKDFGLPEFKSGYAKVTGFDYLGEEQDDLVLLLESDYLEIYHNQLINLGYKHSFDSLLLHTTIKYSVDKSIRSFYEVFASTMIGKEIYFHSATKSQLKK